MKFSGKFGGKGQSGGTTNQYDKGFFIDEPALLVAYPNGIPSPTDRDGRFVRLGSTDTVWVRDSGSNAWVDSGLTPASYTASLGVELISGDFQMDIDSLPPLVLPIDDVDTLAINQAGVDYEVSMATIKDYILEQKFTSVDLLSVSATNVAGTLAHTPTSPVRVYVGGGSAGSLVYFEGIHFSILAGVITFNPLATGFDVVTGDIVYAEYQYLGSGQIPQEYAVEPITVTATNVLSSLSNTPNTLVILVVNGLSYIQGVHFTLSGTSLTRLPIANGFDIITTDQVYAIYYY